MAKLFIGLAVAAMLAAAAFSFLAKGNVDKLQSSLKGTKDQLTSTTGQLTKSKAETAKAQEEKVAADAETKKAQEETAAQKLATEEADKRAKAAMEASNEKDGKITDLEKKLADAMSAPKTPTGVQDDPRLTELTLQNQKLTAELAEAKTVGEKYKQDLDNTSAKLTAAEQRERLRSQNVTRAGLTGRILAVNPGWNFVVLSVGDKSGVTMNAPLLVVRGNEPIARLRITSIEPNTSIADLIPSSVRKGTSIQPGDTVIFEGGRTASPAAKAPGAEAEAVPTN